VAEGQTKALQELTSFMGDFVDNNFGRVGLRRQIVMPSYSSVLFRNPPPMAMGEQPCTMVPDKTWEFTSVMFLGCELDFLCFNILCYSIFDLWFNDTITSILLTYLFDSMLCLIRGNFGRSILARKVQY
jgi:hypothetical protein